MRRTSPWSTVALLFLLCACGGGGGGGSLVPRAPGTSTSATSPPLLLEQAPQLGKIKHIVFILQENRTFDGLFGGPNGFPGADTASSGLTSNGTVVPLTALALGWGADLNNDYQTWLKACDPSGPLVVGQPWPCKMDGFDQNPASSTDAYNYAPYNQTAPYWDIAHKYALSDHFFASHNSESYTAHQYLFAGQSGGTLNAPVPSSSGLAALTDWNCEPGNNAQRTFLWQPNVTTTTAIPSGSPIGPRPCWSYVSLADLLNAAGVSWRVYEPFVTYNINALASMQSIYNSKTYWPPCFSLPFVGCTKYYNNDYFRADTSQFFWDFPGRGKYGTLAGVTWFLPPLLQSDHVLPTALKPTVAFSGGPQWVASVVNTIGNSPDWSSTVIFITWDDWGGNYDHVKPYVVRDAAGVGFRVPLIIVSPYTKPGCILNQTNAEFGTLLKFAEATFGLGQLGPGAVDQSPYLGNFDQCFDWSTARSFRSVAGGQSAQYYENLQDPTAGDNIDDGVGD